MVIPPWNNDLVGEDPAKIGTFHHFIKALQEQLPGMQIVDFCPLDGDDSSGVLEEGGCRFIGFNNASFKSNESSNDAERFEASQKKNVDEVVRRLKTGEPTFIFYHIPEIDDPFPAFGPSTAEDKVKLAEREKAAANSAKIFLTPPGRSHWACGRCGTK